VFCLWVDCDSAVRGGLMGSGAYSSLFFFFLFSVFNHCIIIIMISMQSVTVLLHLKPVWDKLTHRPCYDEAVII